MLLGERDRLLLCCLSLLSLLCLLRLLRLYRRARVKVRIEGERGQLMRGWVQSERVVGWLGEWVGESVGESVTDLLGLLQ